MPLLFSNEIISAIIYAGIPIAAISYFFLQWAEGQGFIFEKKERKQDKKDNQTKYNPVLEKWSTFGGGYYGIMALITYVHVEIMDLYNAFSKFESIQQMLDALTFNFLIGLIMEALYNFITAIIWFTYWDEVLPISHGWYWLLASYAGFYLAEQKLFADKFISNQN
ncbi:MAG: hypothetical protein V2I33_09620 [Kangiellaceae bacterium]|jgi:hypothetical protein|nr:hypothetical protein [Kangiellaceae bacterium]